jgi:hypothetical protein
MQYKLFEVADLQQGINPPGKLLILAWQDQKYLELRVPKL